MSIRDSLPGARHSSAAHAILKREGRHWSGALPAMSHAQQRHYRCHVFNEPFYWTTVVGIALVMAGVVRIARQAA